ncbi:MAG: hypothetical protein VKJ64_13535 [Leptolyngbyaceae bacterium]|nr:hypothetical protein [Leptolyngbyaceae bacterium]
MGLLIARAGGDRSKPTEPTLGDLGPSWEDLGKIGNDPQPGIETLDWIRHWGGFSP